MKKAVNLYFCRQLPFDTRTKLQTIKQVGYDEFFTGYFDAHETLPWREQIALAKQLGLGLTMIHCQYDPEQLNAFWLPGALGDQVRDFYLTQIRACGGYTRNFVVHLHGDRHSQTTPFGIARLRTLLAACEPFNLHLCVENLFNAAEIPYIFAHIQHPLLKICYDCGHQHWLTPQFDLVAAYHQYITVLHLHENDGTADQHQILTPGSPVFQKLLHDLPLLNPDVSLASEIKIGQGTCAGILRANLQSLTALDQALQPLA